MKIVSSLKKCAGKKVIVRVDYNVPVVDGKVVEVARIKATLPTIKYLLKNGADILLVAHFGRPDGKKNNKYSLKQIIPSLEKIIGKKVIFWDGIKLQRDQVPSGRVVMLENIRFWAEEENNDQKFAKKLASLGDFYVNEAFSNAHRNHASMVGLPKYLPSFAGFELAEEVKHLQEIIKSKTRPKVAIVGGAKISTKIELIKTLSKTMDWVLIGGALANNFLQAKNLPIGKSVYEKDFVATAKKLLNKKIILPIDGIVANSINSVNAESKIFSEINNQEMILDIGLETVALFSAYLTKAKLVVWNGPMGYLENPLFCEGDGGIINTLKQSKVKSVIGGGETLEAVDYYKARKYISYCSMAGGAMLEFLTKNGKLNSLSFLEK